MLDYAEIQSCDYLYNGRSFVHNYSVQEKKRIYQDLWAGKTFKVFDYSSSSDNAFILFDSNMTSENDITYLLLASINWALDQFYFELKKCQEANIPIIPLKIIKDMDLSKNFEEAFICYLKDEMTRDRYPQGPFENNFDIFLSPSYVCSKSYVCNLIDFLYSHDHITSKPTARFDPELAMTTIFRVVVYKDLYQALSKYQPKPVKLEPYKLRISVETAKVATAFDALIPIIFNSEIQSFKVLKDNCRDSERFNKGGQITIYIHSNITLDDLKKLRKEIFTKMSEKNIKPGIAPESDIVIDPYMSGRVDRINDTYFEAPKFFLRQQRSLNLQNKFLSALVIDGAKDRLEFYANERNKREECSLDIPILRSFQWKKQDKAKDARDIVNSIEKLRTSEAIQSFFNSLVTQNRPCNQGELGDIVENIKHAFTPKKNLSN